MNIIRHRQVTTSRNNLVMEILCDEFGYHLVEKAIKHKETYRSFEKYNPRSISEFFNELSYKWQMGNAKEYLETLDEWIQVCLICHLAEDYINDKSCADLTLRK